MEFNYISSLHLDALREIGNIASGNAATSLSFMTEKKIEMEVPMANVIGFNEVLTLVGGPEQKLVALLFQVNGDAPSTVYFLLSYSEAVQLVKQITKSEFVSLDKSDENYTLSCSALMEVGNILVGSYLSALSDFTNINMQPSTPNLSIDMAGAILSIGLIEISEITDSAIVINTKIIDHENENKINGNFLMIPHVESIPKILNALGLESDE